MRLARSFWLWTVLAVVASAALAWSLAPPPTGAPAELHIERGAPVRRIARDLGAAGLVRSPHVFEAIVRLRGAERSLKAGRYELPRGVPPWTLVDLLEEGVIELHQVTIPEGLWLNEVAGLLARHAQVDSAAFMRVVLDSTVAVELGVPSRNLEGYLFPDTYDVPVGQEPRALIERMVATSLAVLGEVGAQSSTTTLAPAEVMVVASIVEAEARVADERPRIAAVYLNRIDRGWRLEADPTVIYALGERRPRLFYRDLEVQSPWNTYRVTGLPPTPICSPGQAAIAAVAHPTAGCEDMFFVAQDDGRHRFARTRAEHERNRREIKAARRRSQ